MALDVGSTKTCAVIGEVDETGVKFVSMGAAESKGLRKGLIANIAATATSVRRAIEEAEGVAHVPVERADRRRCRKPRSRRQQPWRNHAGPPSAGH